LYGYDKKITGASMENTFKIGHYTDTENITGCTVILCPPDTVASCYISGSAPGSREIALLDPVRKINSVHALFLTGGSAFGLNGAAGVVQYLEEKKIGYETHFGVVPIVPAAVIYDLNIGNNTVRPTAENAYQACRQASDNFEFQGSVGAGTGATVGKWSGISKAMKGGLGITTLFFEEIFVRAVSIVNAVGDVIDENGNIVAGAVNDNGDFVAEGHPEKRWERPEVGLSENTVLCAILTNVKMSKMEAYTLSRRSQNGLARAIIPTSTSFDGDVIFSLACGSFRKEMDIICELAAEALRCSIIAAVENAESLAGYRTFKNLKG
jgi:L-aminopeptidase/D-esterase-like protein